VLDTRCLTAIVYTRAVPQKFLEKHLLRHLTEDGAAVIDEFMNTPSMVSTEVWNLLHRDDRDMLRNFLAAFGKHKWKWKLVMVDDEELSWTQKERSHSRKDG
jgi:hypothetical protein